MCPTDRDMSKNNYELQPSLAAILKFNMAVSTESSNVVINVLNMFSAPENMGIETIIMSKSSTDRQIYI